MPSDPFINLTPVLPSSDIRRDINWYEKQTGFKCIKSDAMYAVLKRGDFYIHLQWHAGTDEDPLLGGSVIKFFVNEISIIFQEFVDRKTVNGNKLRKNTPWNTHEFGFYDLNKNAIFMVEDI